MASRRPPRLVRSPNSERHEEDLRRSHRERDYLVHERTAHINRIKELLFAQGIRGINVKRQYKTLHFDKPTHPKERRAERSSDHKGSREPACRRQECCLRDADYHNYEVAMTCWGLNERPFVVVWLLAQFDADQP